MPPQGAGTRGFERDGQPVPAGTEWPTVTTVTVSPAYFEVLGVSIERGRAFTDGERFVLALQGMEGKRLTYKALIGALEGAPGSDAGEGSDRLPN